MNEIEKLLKNVALVTIGAAATVVEKGGEVAKALIEKGEATMKENQAFTDELTRKGKQVMDAVVEGFNNIIRDAATDSEDDTTGSEEADCEMAEEAAAEAAEAAAEAEETEAAEETAAETNDTADVQDDADEAEDEPTYSVEEEEANG